MRQPTATPTARPVGPGLVGRLIIAILAAMGVGIAVGAYPTPASVPYRWELDFRPGDLRLYVDPLDGAAYWFFNYTVTNRTGADQIWAPGLVLFTDNGAILRSGEGVPSRLEEGIRDLLGNPLIETQNEIIGDIRQGPEHAKDGLVVWPAIDLDVTEVDLFIGGLSGETARVMNPVTGEESILRKTLHRRYVVRGTALPRGKRPIELVDEGWVLR